MADPTPPSDETQAALDEAKALLQQGRFDAAGARTQTVLHTDPDHADALYMLAVARRYAKDLDGAQTALDRLTTVSPHYGRAHQEQGHLSLALGDKARALDAYDQAVRYNPALTASWNTLAKLHREAGHTDASEKAMAQVNRLRALPPELVSVTSFMHEGRLLKAERLARAFLKKNPSHVEGMRLLANLGVKLHVLDDAEFLLESGLTFEPDNIPVRIDYVDVLQKRQKFAQARREAESLLARDPDNPLLQTIYANACMAVGDYGKALDIFDGVVTKAPDPASIHLSRGHALKTMGRQADAVEAYRAAYATRPAFGDAYWSLANLKTYRFTEDEIVRMEAREEDPKTPLTDRYHLCFALGKAHEDTRDFAAAFSYYERGNRLKKDELRYSADRMEAELSLQQTVCTDELFAKQAGKGCDAPDPIFIVGLPRAGSTLLEQILASHTQVDGTLELPNILAMAHRLNGRRKVTDEPLYPAVLHDLDAEDLRTLGESYLEETRIHRAGAPFFTDKMPNNFRHIGLIHLVLPNAKIIDARRHPLACCFSGFKQLFAEGQEFTYGLEEIGRYYRGYVDLMDHWDRVLPGQVLRVQYEEVVADLETQVRRILDFCGLPFEQACLDFHKTDRSVRTASSEQVRQPLYRSGVEQWRHFEPYLDPLKAALGPALTDQDTA